MNLPPGTPQCVIDAVATGRLTVASDVGVKPPSPSPPGRKRPAGKRGRPEEEFQRAVIDYARLHGWLVAHFRPVRVQRKNGSVYFETPAAADGKGFPDLVLLREKRLIVAELKVGSNKPSPEQEKWLAAFGKLSVVQTFVWRPESWPQIEELLR